MMFAFHHVTSLSRKVCIGVRAVVGIPAFCRIGISVLNFACCAITLSRDCVLSGAAVATSSGVAVVSVLFKDIVGSAREYGDVGREGRDGSPEMLTDGKDIELKEGSVGRMEVGIVGRMEVGIVGSKEEAEGIGVTFPNNPRLVPDILEVLLYSRIYKIIHVSSS